MHWATDVQVTPMQKLVLLVLAPMDRGDGSIFPSAKWIARKTCLSVGGVRKVLKSLEVDGLIRRERRFDEESHRETSSTIYLVMDGYALDEADRQAYSGGNKGVPSRGRGGAPSGHRGGAITGHPIEQEDEIKEDQEHTREPSSRSSSPIEPEEPDAVLRDPSEVPSSRAPQQRRYSQEFEEFWRLYPAHRRREKPKAFQEWRAAVRRVEPAKIMAGLRLYVRGDVQFAPYPAKWLKNDSWDDLPISVEATVSVPDRRIRDILDEDAREFAARSGEDHW